MSKPINSRFNDGDKGASGTGGDMMRIEKARAALDAKGGITPDTTPRAKAVREYRPPKDGTIRAEPAYLAGLNDEEFVPTEPDDGGAELRCWEFGRAVRMGVCK